MEDFGGFLASLVFDDIGTDEHEEENEQKSDLICLDGDMGAGKTALARGFIRTAFGDSDIPVTSPRIFLATPTRQALHLGILKSSTWIYTGSQDLNQENYSRLT